jgi:hypothetical protein
MLKPGSRPQRIARRTATALVYFISVRPRLRRLASRLINYFPSMSTRIKAMLQFRDNDWTLEPDSRILDEWRTLLRLPRT